MTNAVFIREILRVVHDREKLQVHEESRGRSTTPHIEAGRSWSYGEILELVQQYDAANAKAEGKPRKATQSALARLKER